MSNVTGIYYGLIDDMVAEVAAFDFRTIGISDKQCKYVVMAVGDEQYDSECFSTIKDAKDAALYQAKFFNCKICRV